MTTSRRLRAKLAESRYAPAAALPGRIRHVAHANGQLIKLSASWLANSRERTNFTYDLTELNRLHLAWWVAGVTNRPVDHIRAYFAELDEDSLLLEHIRQATITSSRSRFADPDARYGRRLGWYALVRALRPELVIETGTDKGLGSCVFAAALLKNGGGRLTTIDINDDSGYLISGRYAQVIDRLIGDSVTVLAAQKTAPDIFIHDSLHTYEHEMAEYNAVGAANVTLMLSDNAENTAALPDWASANGRHFAYFAEAPLGHWYPGSGIGAAFMRSIE